jgi:Fic family protein
LILCNSHSFPSKIYCKDLLELLFEKPYIRIGDIVDEGIASRNIAANYLRTLEKMGIVRSEKKGRNVLYINIPSLRYFKKVDMHCFNAYQ